MLSSIPEVIEPHSRTLSTIRIVNLSCTDSNPCQLASYAVPFGLWSYASDADHCIEFPTTDCSHAVIATELTRFRIGIAVVGSFVDERSHRRVTPQWRSAPSEAIPSAELDCQCLLRILVRARQHGVRGR